jgi:alkyl sulfatase BDS1-like metallo-beta-lactamase superfamily hydrolase
MADDDTLRGMLEQVRTPQELQRLLDTPGVDDQVIDEFVTAVGADAVLDRVFDLMGSRFLPEKAGDDAGVVQWNVDTAEGRRVYHVTIGGGQAEGARGVPDKPRTTLTMSTPNLMRLCAGKLSGVTGVMTGKIKIGGDMMFGAKMQGFFDY